MACEDAASFKKTAPEDKFSCDVCFVGNYTEEQRLERFQREYLLPAARYRFGLWGTNWERSGIKEIREAAKGRLEPADIARAYSSAKIVLASHCFVHREEEIITTRIYEALASESFVISDYFKALDEFSDHLVFTTGGKDLDDKLRYYLSNPEARSKKTKGARELILRNHTFKNRVEIIAKNIGIEFR
jgi:spore maturation protein CgeB